jgi:hypothetical protein
MTTRKDRGVGTRWSEVEILPSRASFSMTWTLLLALLCTGADRNANTISSRPSGRRGHLQQVNHPIRRLRLHAERSTSAPNTSHAIPIRARETISCSSWAKRITRASQYLPKYLRGSRLPSTVCLPPSINVTCPDADYRLAFVGPLARTARSSSYISE